MKHFLKKFARADLLSVLGIFAAGAILYFPTLHHSFHFDDFSPSFLRGTYIYQYLNFKEIWEYGYQLRFIPNVTLAINYHFNRLNPFGYHIFNLTVHLFTAAFLFILAKLTYESPAMQKHPLQREAGALALLSALLFLVHPVQTQAVLYIVQRVTGIAAFFYLGTLVFYALFKKYQRRIYYDIALFFCICAMFSKEISFTLPIVLFLYSRMFWAKSGEKKSAEVYCLSPFLLTMFMIPLLFLVDPENFKIEGLLPREKESAVSRGDYFLTQINVLRTYLRLLFFPVAQNLDYDYPIARTLLEWKTAASAALLLSLGGLAFAIRKNHKIIAFGIFWFFITLSVESSIIPIKDVIFEHRLYLPSVGFALAVPVLFTLLIKSRKIKIAVLILAVLILAAATWQRSKVWKNDITLWQDVLKKSPHKSRAYHSLSNTYYTRGRFHEGLEYANKAIEIDPDIPIHYLNLSLNKEGLGLYDEQIEALRKAFKLNPSPLSNYLHRMGMAYIHKGENELGISFLERSVMQNINYVWGYYDLANAYADVGIMDGAIECYQRAILINPRFAEAHNGLGMVYGKTGKIEQALYHLHEAVRYNPRFAQAYNNLGTAYSFYNRDLNLMIAYFEKAIEASPSYLPAYENLARVYKEKGDFDKAVEYEKKAEELKNKLKD